MAKKDNSKSKSKTSTKVAAAVGVAAAATAAGVAAVKALSHNKTVVHVEPKGERWQIMIEGNKNATAVYDSKREAVDDARSRAHRKVPSELIIHKSDGSEQRRHHYDA